MSAPSKEAVESSQLEINAWLAETDLGRDSCVGDAVQSAIDSATASLREENAALLKANEELTRQLAEAILKISRISGLITLLEQKNDAQTDTEVAVSASFQEAILCAENDDLERQLDEWKTAAKIKDEALKRIKQGAENATGLESSTDAAFFISQVCAKALAIQLEEK